MKISLHQDDANGSVEDTEIMKHPPNNMKPRVQVLDTPRDSSRPGGQNNGVDDQVPRSLITYCLNAFRCWTWSRTVTLRVLFVFCLVLAMIVCCLASYITTRQLELNVGRQTFESVAASALKAAHEITLRKYQAAKVMESVLSYAFPDADMWPFVGLNGYYHISGEVAALASIGSVGMVVLVKPGEEAKAFETHAREHFADQGYPAQLGVSDFGFGIYTKIAESPYSDGRVPSLAGNETAYGSPYTILAPLMDHSMWNTSAVMYDVHSTDSAVDAMIECTEHASQESYFAASPAGATNAPDRPACTVSTGFKTLISRPDLASLVDQPIYPANDPSTLVGFVGTSIQWGDVLDGIVPDFIDELVAVISTDSQWHSNTGFDMATYVIRNGRPIFLGEGDQHDRKYDEYARSTVLNEVATNATKSVQLRLTVYPASFDQFTTKSPVALSMGFAVVIVICTLVFFAYDFLMRRDIDERDTILETKRRFVRFISHEIRTPLNTVCMGLELLESELEPHRDKTIPADTSSPSLPQVSSPSGTQVHYWHEITHDIQENASTAVGILNELLKYDKIETGNLELEIGQVFIWDLVSNVVNQFKLQAAKKEIDLSLTFLSDDIDCDLEAGNGSVSNALRELVVIGDDMRLRETMRNLCSNALKFAGTGGKIAVLVEYNKEGMPEKRHRRKKRNSSLATTSPVSSNQSTDSLEDYFCFPRAGSILISVTDNGVGMTEHQLSRLFQEGVQFNAATLQAGGGSGLGLCISKSIVERHDGTIVAKSPGEGKGCTFVVELPLFDSSQERVDNSNLGSRINGSLRASTCSVEQGAYIAGDMSIITEDSGAAPSMEKDQKLPSSFCATKEKQPPQSLVSSVSSTMSSDAARASLLHTEPFEEAKHTVLVVDDVLSNRKMLVRLLERDGHTCISAGDGQQAIDAVIANRSEVQDKLEKADGNTSGRQQAIDTILMDYEMPIMNGPDATYELRQLGYVGDILGVTGNVLQEDVNYFKANGANDVLPKPVNVALLKKYWQSRVPSSGPMGRQLWKQDVDDDDDDEADRDDNFKNPPSSEDKSVSAAMAA